MHVHRLILATAFAAALAPAAFADHHSAADFQTMQTDLGEILVTANGMTLYIFDKDEPGVTNCYEQCAVNWPPFLATDSAVPEGDFTLVERNDGTRQWAHDGWPLYLWINDENPGDTTGDMVGGVWHVVVMGDAM